MPRLSLRAGTRRRLLRVAVSAVARAHLAAASRHTSWMPSTTLFSVWRSVE